jgi:hypothetical protein
VPTFVAVIGCTAGVMLWRGWDGGALWGDEAHSTVESSPTAPAAAG